MTKLLKKPQLRQGYGARFLCRCLLSLFLFNFKLLRTTGRNKLGRGTRLESRETRTGDDHLPTDGREIGTEGEEEMEDELIRREEKKKKKRKVRYQHTATRYKEALWVWTIAFAMLLRPLWILFFRGSFTSTLHIYEE